MATMLLYGLAFLAGLLVVEYCVWRYLGSLWTKEDGMVMLLYLFRNPIHSCVLIPILEEAVFRLLVIGAAMYASVEVLWAVVLLQGIVFGLLHGQYFFQIKLIITAEAIGMGVLFVYAAQTSNIVQAFLLVAFLHMLKNTLALGLLWAERIKRQKARLG